jgi:hypothetical protein
LSVFSPVVKEAFVYGDKNLERPALLSAQSIVDVHVTLLKEQSKQSSQVPLLLQAKVSVPLHARYPVNAEFTCTSSSTPISLDCLLDKKLLTPQLLISKWNDYFFLCSL